MDRVEINGVSYDIDIDAALNFGFAKPIDYKPVSWEGYKKYCIEDVYYVITKDERIRKISKDELVLYGLDKAFPTKKLAEAYLALSRLINLHYAWEKTVVSNIIETEESWCIYYVDGSEEPVIKTSTDSHLLSFCYKDEAEEFYKNFKDIIKQASPLL